MTDTAAPAEPFSGPRTALYATRSFWPKQLHQWHWISAALGLTGLLLFAVSGVTLNPGLGDTIAANAQYVAVMEVLP